MITGFFKRCLKGIGYVFLFPIFLVVLSCYAIIGVVQFFVVGITAIVYFFSGRNLFGDFPEDVKAKEIMSGKDVGSLVISETPKVTPPTTEDYFSQTQSEQNEDSGVDINSMGDDEK